MKKKIAEMIFNSQMFADGAESTAENAAENAAENTESKQGRTYTDADLDEIIGKKFAKWQAQQQKKVDEAARLAKMTEQERAAAEKEALQKELDELKREKTMAEMGRQARSILSGERITLPDELVSMLITDDADSTSANIKAFAKLFKEAVAEEVKAQLKGKAPAKAASPAAITREQILAIEDARERQKMIKNNLSLFK